MNPLDTLGREFSAAYGVPPTLIVRAPGRVNLIGEHTDYNDGFVLPMAIERAVLIAATPTKGHAIRIRSISKGQARDIELKHPIVRDPEHNWSNYLRGVVAGFLERQIPLSGLDLLVDSTVPVGVGLASSAALEVAAATLLEEVTGHKLGPLNKAYLCQRAEHQYAGVPCGIMDQFISVHAHQDEALLLDCRSLQAQAIPLADPSIAVLVVSTNVKHELARSEYPLRRTQCHQAARALSATSLRDISTETLQTAAGRLDATHFKRARHVVTEMARTLRAAEALRARQWQKLGELMYESHESLRTDFEVSCQELDTVVEVARGIGSAGGVYGCRMTGGGFGGCAVALIATGTGHSIADRITEEYIRRIGQSPTIFTSRPAAGASTISYP